MAFYCIGKCPYLLRIVDSYRLFHYGHNFYLEI